MARSRSEGGAAEALAEIESFTDRLAEWAWTHAWALGGVVAAILIGTGAVAVWSSWSSGRSEAASDALAEVRADYLQAMGADPDSFEVPELANPEAGARVRREYVDRFLGVAEAHGGTVPAALAWLEVGRLRQELGEAEGAFEAWERGLEELPGGAPLRGTLLQQIGLTHEQAERWSEAAGAYERAGAIEAFPLRYWALVDAARCHDLAGDAPRARELLERVEAEVPALVLPEHLRLRLRELRALASAPSPATP